ncbi:cytotoxin/hemolysin, TlyA [Mycobacterium bohemicum DSM 44277]|uniref:Cytotoxin/hemolysin, TlyA n=1 Tax=Mycobacterium bohemicum DSM 44277 TaxID=1236609 RepID=A0A0U0W634_MYCBE|nr:cytotoxin/hemolysin, TlyA [Mycobacterium bohemicum DSM 44277]
MSSGILDELGWRGLIARRAGELGWRTVDVTPSPLPGPSGNVEYFLWLRAQTDRGLSNDELGDAVRGAVNRGPATMRAGTARDGGTSRLRGRAGQSNRGPA